MKAVILTEGGQKIGFGHITRCIALRDALKMKGLSVSLIVNGDRSLRKQFQGQVDHIFDWLGEKSKTSMLIRDGEIVVVDSYLAPFAFYRRVSKTIPVPVYLDDYVRFSYPKGIVVNGAVRAEKLRYVKKSRAQYLLGPQYAILRKEFWRLPAKKIRREIRDVLITLGAMDRTDFIQELLMFLTQKFPHWRFHVVAASRSNHEKGQKGISKARFYYSLSAPAMRSLMRRCDMAISGGGQTTHELAACGLPTVGICFAENQRVNIHGWRKMGFLKFAGYSGQSKIFRNIEASLKELSYRARRHMSLMGQALVDGNGPSHVARAIADASFTFSAMQKRDRHQVFEWANDPQSRSVSFHSNPIAWPEHCAWFNAKLKDPNSLFYKVRWLDRTIGQVRFDRIRRKATISVMLDRKYRGKGFGSLVIRLAVQKVFRETGIDRVDALVKQTNAASLRVFTKAGFEHRQKIKIQGQEAYRLTQRKKNDE